MLVVTARVVVVWAVIEAAVEPVQDSVLVVGFNGQFVLESE